MFGKCIKHEFRATSRQLVPLFIAMLFVSILGGVFFGWTMRSLSSPNDTGITGAIGGMLSGVFIFLLIGLMVTVSIGAFVMIIRRFYTSFFTDEGYLTFTLPVTMNTHIASKLFVAYVWQIAASIVSLISIFLMGLITVLISVDASALQEMLTEIRNIPFDFIFGEFFEEFSALSLTASSILFIVMTLLSVASSILMLYLAIAVACMLAKKHRVILGIVSYYLISMVFSVGNSIAQVIMGFVMDANVEAGILIYLGMMNVLTIIQFLLCFLGTRWILSKKLNLD